MNLCDLPWLRVETSTACFAVAVREGVVVGGADYGSFLVGKNAHEACVEMKLAGYRLTRLDPNPWWERAAEICEEARRLV